MTGEAGLIRRIGSRAAFQHCQSTVRSLLEWIWLLLTASHAQAAQDQSNNSQSLKHGDNLRERNERTAMMQAFVVEMKPNLLCRET
jgi:hypothetical protein